MEKKRVEDKPMDEIILDTEVHETKTEITKNIKESKVPEPSHTVNTNIEEPVSCLRNEKVIGRFIPRPSSMVQNPKHV